MICFLLIQSTIQTVHLAPPIPLHGAISLRRQPGTTHLPKLVSTLRKCAEKQGIKPPWQRPLEIRVVHQEWLDRLTTKPKEAHRKGRYYPARNGHPSLIYVAVGRDALVTLAHEWLHHLASIHGHDWSESWVETHAVACASQAH